MGDWQKSDWGLVTSNGELVRKPRRIGEHEWRVGQKVTGDWSVSRGKSREFLGLWRLVEFTASARGANKWLEEAGRKENWTRLSSQKETEKIKMKRLCWLKWIRLNDVQALYVSFLTRFSEERVAQWSQNVMFSLFYFDFSLRMKVLGISWGALDCLVALDVNTCNLAEVECFVQGMQTSLDFEYVRAVRASLCRFRAHKSKSVDVSVCGGLRLRSSYSAAWRLCVSSSTLGKNHWLWR